MKKQYLYLLVVIPVVVCLALIITISLTANNGIDDETKITDGNIEDPDTSYSGYYPLPPLPYVTTAPEDAPSAPSDVDPQTYLSFSKLEDGTYQVSLTEKDLIIDHIEIPEEYLGDAVTKIARDGFRGSRVVSVTVPSSVTEIDSFAFAECHRLSSVELSHGLETIEDAAFAQSAIKSIVIPDTVTDISDWAFFECKRLVSVEFSNSLGAVAKGLFHGCSELKDVCVPESVEHICENAFAECTDLESITLPFLGGTKTADYKTALLGWIFDSSASNFRSSRLKTVTLTGGNIYSSSFKGFYNLKNIIIEGDAKIAETGAFSDCESLESLTLPSMEIEDRQITINQYFGMYAKAPKSLKNVTISSGIIGINAFREVSSIEKVTLGEGVTLVKNSAFLRCTALKGLTVLNNEIESFYLGAFSQCSNLTDIYFDGTKAEWSAIKKHNFWDSEAGNYTVHCSDGDMGK